MALRAIVLGLATLLVACGGGDTAPTTKRTATPLDLSTTGTIRGEVTFNGTPPPMKELAVRSFPGCASEGDGPVLSGDALVKDGRVQNAFVYIKSGLGDRVFAIPETAVEIDQKGCIYVPRVVGAQVGQQVLYKNSDTIMHNVHALPTQAQGFNMILANKGMSRAVQLERAEIMIPVRCDVHPWMQSYVGIVDHPYFAVTGADGRFELKQVPPGTYTVAVWHERFGTKDANVTVAPKGDQTLTFALSATSAN